MAIFIGSFLLFKHFETHGTNMRTSPSDDHIKKNPEQKLNETQGVFCDQILFTQNVLNKTALNPVVFPVVLETKLHHWCCCKKRKQNVVERYS